MSLHTDERPIDEAEVATVNKPDEKINVEPAKKEEASSAPPLDADAEEMELLADLRRKTDKDVDGSAKASETSPSSADDFGTSASSSASTGSGAKPAMYLQNHELVAKLCVNCMNVLLGMILQVIADDWTEEAEKKYTLSPTRKSEILEPLTLVLAQSKNKYNPVVILIITVLVAYTPMFMTAFRARKEKGKLKKVKKTILDKTGEEVRTEDSNDITSDLKRQIRELQSEINDVSKKPLEEKVKVKEIFKLTEAQEKRLTEIKKKKGRRSAKDEEFLKDLGLSKFI